MFCDTHFHFETMVNAGVDGAAVLSGLAMRGAEFALDIGTKPGDLLQRQACVRECLGRLSRASPASAKKIGESIYFTAGIWPGVEEIHNRFSSVERLEQCIREAECTKASPGELLPHRKIIAIGECGIDRHWNPSGVDGRSESDFDAATCREERELFKLQLELAKRLSLPVVVHSRDGFEETIECIDEVGWHNGIIHCFSYGLEQALAFLDRGWYLAFGGGVTYTKKSRLPELHELLRMVPDDRLLCETDAPYLAPVPFMGQRNTPVLVEHVYRFIAEIRGSSAEELSSLVFDNVRTLFGIR